MTPSLVISEIWRYPIKGLGGESLSSAVISARGIAGDRRWMLAHSDIGALISGVEKWRPWNYCIALKNTPSAARLQVSLNGDILTIRADNDAVSGNPTLPRERRQIELFAQDFFGDNRLFLADCDQRPAWDEDNAPLTAVFIASVTDLSCHTEFALDVRRFRGNIIIGGGAPWQERLYCGELLNLGDEVTLLATAGVPRCAATKVNPESGQRDINVCETLVSHYGHNEVGVLCAINNGGGIAVDGRAAWQKIA